MSRYRVQGVLEKITRAARDCDGLCSRHEDGVSVDMNHAGCFGNSPLSTFLRVERRTAQDAPRCFGNERCGRVYRGQRCFLESTSMPRRPMGIRVVSEDQVQPGPASLLRPTWFEIDLDAIAHNLHQLRRRLGNRRPRRHARPHRAGLFPRRCGNGGGCGVTSAETLQRSQAAYTQATEPSGVCIRFQSEPSWRNRDTDRCGFPLPRE